MAVGKVRLVVFTTVLTAAVVTASVLPVFPWLVRLFERMAALGPLGPFALIGVYVVFCVFLFPASIPTLAAGILFGVLKGSLVAMAGGIAGACAAYWIGRLAARDWVVRRIAGSHRFTALDDAVDENGLVVVFLSRLSPIAPYAILNYAFGLTKISFWKYLLGTVIGVAPAMIMFVYIGAGLRSFAEVVAYVRGEGPTVPVYRVFFWAGLVLTVLVTVLLMCLGAKVLRPGPRSELREEPVERVLSEGR
ncbi:MAG TPA: TVP38/TMEM64 family protein [Sedimentisphaerales bacterium]|nr:TVP38/TMEM64 family protein [Phycisphaerae bacterium]HON92507.1 TVP38/TMEM64 family protein [Sedimentisphaerales bacterium]HQG49106.1 TVP38/TMEM64 family protein [Sedimentisphaerales bacterium]HQI26521.1 TVP38/TMEM64 family protein [Sedimentisphaerales bacterium]